METVTEKLDEGAEYIDDKVGKPVVDTLEFAGDVVSEGSKLTSSILTGKGGEYTEHWKDTLMEGGQEIKEGAIDKPYKFIKDLGADTEKRMKNLFNIAGDAISTTGKLAKGLSTSLNENIQKSMIGMDTSAFGDATTPGVGPVSKSGTTATGSALTKTTGSKGSAPSKTPTLGSSKQGGLGVKTKTQLAGLRTKLKGRKQTYLTT